MARKAAATTKNGHLEEALANLINNQAMFIRHLGRADERFAKMDERFTKTDERFARIEAELAEIKTILLHHERILEALPEVIRQKVGFEPR